LVERVDYVARLAGEPPVRDRLDVDEGDRRRDERDNDHPGENTQPLYETRR
jgi:hypothetical protein